MWRATAGCNMSHVTEDRFRAATLSNPLYLFDCRVAAVPWSEAVRAGAFLLLQRSAAG